MDLFLIFLSFSEMFHRERFPLSAWNIRGRGGRGRGRGGRGLGRGRGGHDHGIHRAGPRLDEIEVRFSKS